MNNAKERRKLDKLLLGDPDGEDQATKDGLQQTVVNARGRSRGFYVACLFLLSLHTQRAAHDIQRALPQTQRSLSQAARGECCGAAVARLKRCLRWTRRRKNGAP